MTMTTPYDFVVKTPEGEDLDLEHYEGQLLLIVNTASHCGFTPQFEGLQTLYDRYKSDDSVYFGLPCDQFKDQEFDNINETMNFCQVNDNTTFPLFARIDVGKDYLPVIKEALNKWPVALHADDEAQNHTKASISATDVDWETQFLDYILAVKIVDSLEKAISHIKHYSTSYLEAIVTNDYFSGMRFHREIDFAAVYRNASTRFTDGFEFGSDAEINISTQKLHARGSIRLFELAPSKYIVFG